MAAVATMMVAGTAQAQLVKKTALTLDGAKQVVAEAGLKVDQQGNIYVCGPGGIWILSPEGKHLGAITPPEEAHNLAWAMTMARRSTPRHWPGSIASG